MAAGRRRRNSSSANKSRQSANLGRAKLQTDPKEEAVLSSNPIDENPAPIAEDTPESSSVPAPLTATIQDTLPVDDLDDDPFAYDSDLETLSSVSSQISMSSSGSSALDRAFGLAAAAGLEEQEAGESAAADKDEMSGNESRSSSKRKTPSLSDESDEGEDDDQHVAEQLDLRRPSNTSSARPKKRIRRQRDSDKAEPTDVDQDGDSIMQTPDSDANSPEVDDEDAHDKHSHDHQVEESNDFADKGSEKQDGQSPSADGGESNNDNGSQDEDAADNEARRSAAFAELTSIEIEFAQLRERLYTERLQQVQIEEDYLLAGRHAEYERNASDITNAYKEQMERLQYEQQEWLKQRQHLHQTLLKSTNYTFLVRRQELRTRLLNAQRKRMWRMRDARVQEDRRSVEKRMASAHMSSYNPLPIDEDVALITQQTNSNIQQLRWARRAASNAQRCLVHGRKQRLAAPGLDPAEMDADYLAMKLPVHPRKQNSGFRHIYVPPLILDSDVARAAAGANKKRKPRQPKKKQRVVVDKDDVAGGGGAGINGHQTGKEREAAGKGQGQAAAAAAGGGKPQAMAPKPMMARAANNIQQPRANGTGKQMLAPLQQQQAAAAGNINRSPSVSLLRASSAQPASSHPANTAPMSENSGTATAAGEAKAGGSKGRGGSVDMRVPAGSNNPLGLKV
ncbi:hypothetical protein LPJ59_002829 [Coemansia sp. RSA 2399]|nr:hypothetical protein LPJ59_002829 [Coemansia sp. RSA 2399]